MSKAWRKAPRNPLPSEDDVRAVQRALNEAGARPELAVDGRYGPQTRAAVKVYHGLLPDGVVGELTRAALGLG
jgi:peptidoglycan hydrolase-like protein with peptidoglycan-binding domain